MFIICRTVSLSVFSSILLLVRSVVMILLNLFKEYVISTGDFRDIIQRNK